MKGFIQLLFSVILLCLAPAPLAVPACAREKESHPSSPSVARVSLSVAAENLLGHPACSYPTTAREAGVTGTVRLRVLVNEAGNVTDAHAIGGPPSLRVAAAHCAELYRYKPFVQNGKAASVTTEMEITFPQNGLSDRVAEKYENNLNRAHKLLADGEDQQAADLYQQNLDLVRKENPGARLKIAESDSELGHVRFKQHRLSEAESALTEALALFDAEQIKTAIVGRTEEEMGAIDLENRQYAEADAMFKRAVPIFFRARATATVPATEHSMSSTLTRALLGVASADFQLGDLKQSSLFCNRAINESRDADLQQSDLKTMYSRCSEITQAAGNNAEAAELRKHAEHLSETTTPR